MMESLAIRKEVKSCVWKAGNHIHILAEPKRVECQVLYTQCHSTGLMVARVFPSFYSLFHFWQWAITLLSKQFSSHKLFFEKNGAALLTAVFLQFSCSAFVSEELGEIMICAAEIPFLPMEILTLILAHYWFIHKDMKKWKPLLLSI